jgi:hypothetical protein
MYTLTLHGVDAVADQTDPTKGVVHTFQCLGIHPIEEKAGEDSPKANGSIRSSRDRMLKLIVKFKPFHVKPTTGNTFADYIILLQILKYEYVYLEASTLNRAEKSETVDEVITWTNVWTDLLPITIEPIEETNDADFQHGEDTLSITFQTRDKTSLTDLI